MNDPLFLVISEVLFEKLMNIDKKYSLIGKDIALSLEEVAEATAAAIKGSEGDPVQASFSPVVEEQSVASSYFYSFRTSKLIGYDIITFT